ncbi:MAG: XdhC family protein [Desulfovibrio sp.]|nr:XdhC family protein [Desulfovibrio sp.]
MTSEKDFYGELAKFDSSPDLVDEATDMEEDDEHVLLICGDCPQARALADLADKCGFVVDVAVQTALEAEAGNFSKARKVQALPGFDNLIQACGIGRSHYVCIFAPDEESCLNALYEAIESHAFYIGVWASPEERGDLFAKLKEMGVPDAELAPVCCPIGLSVYAENPVQASVAVVAELLAARAGTLGRLRLDD